MKEKILAIIPARGGSKRIPGKNIKNFLGTPIIAYSIELARSSGLFSEIMVSTDDSKIAETAKYHGADIPFYRSSGTSGDQAILNDVLLETIDNYKIAGKEFAYICMILPTAPLIRLTTLKKSFEILRSDQFDSVRPVVKYSFPIQRSLKMINNKIEMFFPEFYSTRSQDLEPAYHDAGQFYWINKNKSLLDPLKGGVLIPETEAQDIDNENDWILAEMKYKFIHNIS